MNTQKSKNSQVARWFYLLQEFQFTVKYRKGSKMEHVDALSRAPTTEATDTQSELDEVIEILPVQIEDEVLAFQRADPDVRGLIEILEKNAEDRTQQENVEVSGYCLDNGRLMRLVVDNGQEKSLFVVPKGFRKSIVVQHHDLDGHFGVDRTVRKIRQLYWFARMANYVKNHIRCCFRCIANKIPAGKQPAELHPIPPPQRPFERVHIDHVGPFITTKHKNAYVLALVCALTKFVKLYPVRDTKTTTTLKKLDQFIASYGIPTRIVSDRGTCFTSRDFQEYCQTKGIHHTLNSSRWPQANGQIERVNRTLVPAIACSMQNEEQWDNIIPRIERAMNTSFNKTTGKTPFESLHGYLPVFHDDKLSQLVSNVQWVPAEEIQEEIRERVREEQGKYKNRYDKRRFKGLIYDVGEVVFARCAKPSTGESSKLKPHYNGPYVVTECLPGDTYRVRYLNRDYTTTYHVSQLKPYSYRNLEEDDSSTDVEEEDNSECVTNKAEHGETSESGLRPKRQARVPTKFRDYII